jgi:hypothetical protein
MLATPPEGDLQDVVEMRERRVERDEEAAPDERTDTSQDNAQLIDSGPWRRGRRYHTLSIAQCVAPLKDSPQILVLSSPPTRRRCGAADRRWHASDRYGSLASPAEAAHETRSDMTKAMPAMLPPHANVVAAQALGSSSGRYVRRKVSSFSGTGEPSHIA